jgi:hypothetical protein
MRWLLFLSKVTFICNLCFILCLVIRHTQLAFSADFTSFVIIQGWLLSVVFNVLFGVAIITARTRQIPLDIPVWLVSFNFAAMFFQIVYYLFNY